MEKHQLPEQALSRNLKREIATSAALGSVLALGFVLLSTSALSGEQRKAILKRDGTRCRAPHPVSDGANPHGEKSLEIHHISPQRWEKDMGIPEEVRDRPENLITVCSKFHQEHIHPDMKTARRNYGQDKNSYKKAFQYRETLVAQRKPYWETVFDAPMLKRAKLLTERAKEAGWIFPAKPPKQSREVK